MTELDEIFAHQLEFQKKIFPNFEKLSVKEKRDLTKEFLLHMMTEVDELLGNVGEWKTHRFGNKPPIKSGITEELVDIINFIVNIALTWGIDPREVMQKFREKVIINEHKFLQDRKIDELRDKPVAVFDVDGVLNDYPEKFVGFVNEKKNASFQMVDYLNLPRIIPKVEYEKLKLEFREAMELAYSGKEELEKIKTNGISIILLTARPVAEHKKLYTDMIVSLAENGIPFDAVIADKEKGFRMMKDFKNLLFYVDDEPEFVKDSTSYGIRTYLLNKPYNDTFNPAPFGAVRIFSVAEGLDRWEYEEAERDRGN